MRPNILHNYKVALEDFQRACNQHGWTITDNSAVSPNEWLNVKLHCSVVDATDHPIVAKTSVTFSLMRNTDVRDPFKALASYSTDVSTAAEIQWLMDEWQDRPVTWPGKLSAAQKRIVNLLRDGHAIESVSKCSGWRYTGTVYKVNGVTISSVLLDKLREFGVLTSDRKIVRLPDPDPVQ